MADKRPIMLVHGAWHGGWCWRDVRAALVAAGHRVLTPTLTGHGERNHLSTPATNLDTHIRDLVATVDCEELSDLVVVAHSYAGYPCTALADLRADRMAKLIYLDATLPTPGRSFMAGSPPEQVAQAEANLVDGFRLPTLPPHWFDVPPENAAASAWLTRRLTDMPWGCLTQPFPALTGAIDRVERIYVPCTQNSLDGPRANYARAEQAGMRMVPLDAGHDAMVTAPAATADLIMELTRG